MESMFLHGSEDVSRAGYNMKSAADDMCRASSQIDETFRQQRMFMDDWLVRFEDVMTQKNK